MAYFFKLFKRFFNRDLFCSFAFNYHDSSVAFAIGRKVILVIEAERYFREKKKYCTPDEMEVLVKYGLSKLRKKIEDVDYWSMTTFNNPFLDKDASMDDIAKKIKSPYIKKVSFFGLNKEVLITNHHISHAGIYYGTQYDDSLIISCDGGGDIDPKTGTNECIAVFKGHKNTIEKSEILLKGCVTGKTYGLCSSFIYGSPAHNRNSPEGKLMALAGLGNVRKEYYDFLVENYKRIESTDYSIVMDIFESGKLSKLKGQAKELTQDAKDFAATVHSFFIEKRLFDIKKILSELRYDTGSLILTGGASLNLDLNSKVLNSYTHLNHFVAPCCDDTGQSLGSLCILINHTLNKRPIVNLPYLGTGQGSIVFTKDTISKAADVLLHDGILLVHNGKSEIGPRALGNRSFIARADKVEVKIKLSENIKQREWYRPVAPMVPENKVPDYFIGPKQSPYMLYRYEVVNSVKDLLVGAVHVDGSARVQTVSKKQNNFIYDLISEIGKKSGIYCVLNTSLNLQGDPLSENIEDTLNIYKNIDGPKGLVYNGNLIKNSLSDAEM